VTPKQKCRHTGKLRAGQYCADCNEKIYDKPVSRHKDAVPPVAKPQ
jgi:hypothetical protein